MRPRWIRLAGCVIALSPLLLSGGEALAQEPQRGLRLSAGYGAAVLFENNRLAPDAIPALRLGVDGRVTDWLSVGLEWMGMSFVTQHGKERRQNLGLTATAFPVSGFFVAAGLGYGGASRVTVDGPPAECCGDVVIGFHEMDMGSGLTLSTGFDARLTRHWILTPIASVAFQRVAGETVGFSWFGGRITFDTR